MLAKGVCTVIGEFGDFQNGADVDEATIISYSNEMKVGTMAWSWKGNGGQDASLDLSNNWEETDLTDWGKYVFTSDYRIQKTSKLAYSLKGYDGTIYTLTPPSTDPDSKFCLVYCSLSNFILLECQVNGADFSRR